MIKWKLKPEVKKALELTDTDEGRWEFSGSAEGMMYDLLMRDTGFVLEDIIDDEKQMKAIQASISVLADLEKLYDRLTDGDHHARKSSGIIIPGRVSKL